jgi:hypothetical protein
VRLVDFLPGLVFGAFRIQDEAIEIEDKGLYHVTYLHPPLRSPPPSPKSLGEEGAEGERASSG